MITTLLGSFLGLLFGLVLAGPLGAVFGVVVGTSLGMLWSGSGEAARPIPAGAKIVHEEQNLMCETKGRVATASFLRDAQSGAWLDVDACSLCDPNDEVHCAKRCLVLIRGALPKSKHPVADHA